MASRAPRGAAFLLLLAFLGTAGAQEEMSPGLRLRLDVDCASCAGLTEHQQPAATEAIFAAQVNLEPKGDLVVLLSQDGDVLVRDADFAALGLEALARRPQLVAGTPYVALRSVEGLAYEIDYERLALVLRVEPRLLAGRQVIDLAPKRSEDVLRPEPAGGFLNYNLSHTEVEGAPSTLEGAAEMGIRLGEFLFSTDAFSSENPSTSERRTVRLSTTLVRDRRDTLERLAFGDFLTVQPGPLGSSLRLGGISLSRRFSIDPYYVRFPGQVVAGTAALPSEIFVYSNGVLVRRERVAPGSFELQNLVRLQGLQLTEVVVRDVLGNEQRIADPYYYSESLLSPGLDEYSFDAGFERRQFGLESNNYGKPGVAGFYRRGITPGVTLGAHAEALDGRYSVGPTATLRAGTWGVTSLAFAVGGDRDESGQALSLAHTFSSSRWSANAALRLEDAKFRRAASDLIAPRRYDFSATFSYALSAGSNVSLAHQSSASWQGESTRSTVLGYRQRLSRDLYLAATYRQASGGFDLKELMLTLSWHFDAAGQRHFASLQMRRTSETTGALAQLSGGNPEAQGVSYRVSAETENGPFARRVINPAVQWNAQHGVGRAEWFRDAASGLDRRQLSVQGGLAAVGGYWTLARPVADSFAIVKVGEVPDVRVYANNQPVATTGSDGTAFLPRLASYFENPVGIQDKDLPINYLVPRTRYVVSPGLRSGVLLDFRAREVSAVAGRLVRRGNAGDITAFANAEGGVAVGGERRELLTASDGRFYLENMEPGSYAGEAAAGGTLCRFRIQVPASKEVVTELGEVACEN